MKFSLRDIDIQYENAKPNARMSSAEPVAVIVASGRDTIDDSCDIYLNRRKIDGAGNDVGHP